MQQTFIATSKSIKQQKYKNVLDTYILSSDSSLACISKFLYSIFRAYKGKLSKKSQFSQTYNAIRYWTVTIAHIRLVIGIVRYTQSPTTIYFWHNFNIDILNIDTVFFALLHIILITTEIGLIAIGSTLARRKVSDKEKFNSILIWYSVLLFNIFIAMP